jgi:DnaK suppressor protein
MRDPITEGQLRRELDLILVRLERCGRAALTEARMEGDRLAGDVFVDAQLVASQGLEELSYERLARRARMLANALDRVRDGSYGSCEECGRRIPEARRRALPGVTTCVPCQEVGERLHSRPSEAAPTIRRHRVRVKSV